MNDDVELIAFVFDGPPGPENPRFIDTEDPYGNSVGVGDWQDGGDGTWALVVPIPKDQIRREEQ